MNLDIGMFILLDIVIASQITSNSFYRATVVYANSNENIKSTFFSRSHLSLTDWLVESPTKGQ